VPQGQDEHRHGIRVGGSYAREGIFCARAILHGKHANTLAVGNTRKAVGDTDTDALLPAQNGPDTDGRCRIDQRCGGIGAEELYPFALQNG
jgi:hypothetical protein